MNRLRASGVVVVVLLSWSPSRASEDVQAAPQPRVRSAPYVLEPRGFSEAFAAAKDEDERLGVLARRWELVKRAVAHCDVMERVSFHASLAFWQSGWLRTGDWSLQAENDLEQAFAAETQAAVLVRGDCVGDVTIKGGALVHIYGDLKGRITAGGHSEVVIGGDVKEGGGVEGDGIIRIFVGGNVDGFVRNKGWCMAWINGDLNGEIGTGTPTTELHVMGDFNGIMKPTGGAALASVDVRGFMSAHDLENIARHDYTEFSASVALSDAPAGIYPQRPRIINAWWVVHAQRRVDATATQPGQPR